MSFFTGTIISESLTNTDVLKKVEIVSTKVEPITPKHQTPWLKQWTLYKVRIPEEDAEKIAHEISESLDFSHESSWYADFKTETHHYIIFLHKVFSLERDDEKGYNEATKYGISLGIPEYQVDFARNMKKWER